MENTVCRINDTDYLVVDLNISAFNNLIMPHVKELEIIFAGCSYGRSVRILVPSFNIEKFTDISLLILPRNIVE